MGEAVELFLVALLAFLTAHFILALIDIWKAGRLERKAEQPGDHGRSIDFKQSPFDWQEEEPTRRSPPDLQTFRAVEPDRCTCPDYPVETDDECPEHNQAWRR